MPDKLDEIAKAMHAEVTQIMAEVPADQWRIIGEMSEEEFEAQTSRYRGHRFCTTTGEMIRIHENMDLRDALNQLDEVNSELRKAMYSGGLNRSDAENDTMIDDIQQSQQEANAQAMAAMFRTTGRWPYQLLELGLI